VPDQLGQFLPYILAVAGVGISGGVLAAFRAPGVGARSAVQHFAAGAVIAAVASEIVPEVKRTGHPFGILCGFAGFLALFAFELLG
jgi:zinc transporter, ZIP family